MLENQIRRIKDRLSVIQALERYGIEIKSNAGKQKIRCPFHQEAEASFSIFADGSRFNCFGCGKRGDVINLIQIKDGLEFKDALRKAAKWAGVKISKDDLLKVEKSEYPEYQPIKTYYNEIQETLKHEVIQEVLKLYVKHEKRVGYYLGSIYLYLLEEVEDLFESMRVTPKRVRRFLQYSRAIFGMYDPVPKRGKTRQNTRKTRVSKKV